MKLFKKMATILITMLVVFFVFLFWYKQRYSMHTVDPFEINSSRLEQRLLIATQGSEFKNAITKSVTDYFATDSVYIKVIDVSLLEKIDPSDFNAILVMHTWENWKAPDAVITFVNDMGKQRHKLVVLTTSGQGSYKIDGVDAFTGESEMKNIPVFSDSVITRLGVLLKSNY